MAMQARPAMQSNATLSLTSVSYKQQRICSITSERGARPWDVSSWIALGEDWGGAPVCPWVVRVNSWVLQPLSLSRPPGNYTSPRQRPRTQCYIRQLWQARNLIAAHYVVMWELWFLEQIEVPKLWSCAHWVCLSRNTLYVENRLKHQHGLWDVFQQQSETDPFPSKDSCQRREKLLKTINNPLLRLTLVTQLV